MNATVTFYLYRTARHARWQVTLGRRCVYFDGLQIDEAKAIALLTDDARNILAAGGSIEDPRPEELPALHVSSRSVSVTLPLV